MIFLLVPCFSGRTKTARALDLHWFSWKLVTVEAVEAHCHWAQVAHAFGHPMGARLPGQECIICKSYASHMQVTTPQSQKIERLKRRCDHKKTKPLSILVDWVILSRSPLVILSARPGQVCKSPWHVASWERNRICLKLWQRNRMEKVCSCNRLNKIGSSIIWCCMNEYKEYV